MRYTSQQVPEHCAFIICIKSSQIHFKFWNQIMFKQLKEKIFHRHSHEDELKKIQAISEKAKRFEQSVIESMNASYNEPSLPSSYLDSDSLFK